MWSDSLSGGPSVVSLRGLGLCSQTAVRTDWWERRWAVVEIQALELLGAHVWTNTRSSIRCCFWGWKTQRKIVTPAQRPPSRPQTPPAWTWLRSLSSLAPGLWQRARLCSPATGRRHQTWSVLLVALGAHSSHGFIEGLGLRSRTAPQLHSYLRFDSLRNQCSEHLVHRRSLISDLLNEWVWDTGDKVAPTVENIFIFLHCCLLRAEGSSLLLSGQRESCGLWTDVPRGLTTVGEEDLRCMSSFFPCRLLHKVTKYPQISIRPRVKSGAPLGPSNWTPTLLHTFSLTASPHQPHLGQPGTVCAQRDLSASSILPWPVSQVSLNQPRENAHPLPSPSAAVCTHSRGSTRCAESKLFSPRKHTLQKRPRFLVTGLQNP